MKRITLAIIVALLLATLLTTGCTTTNTDGVKKSKKEIQEEYMFDSIYFIQKDGPTLIEYMDNDQSLSLRDKQATKRRLRNLNVQIEALKAE